MAKVLVAPNGLVIRGTLERLSGVGLIYKADLKNGRLEFEYFGTTEIWYDETRTAEDEQGETVFVDEQGNEWPESRLKLVDEKELAPPCALVAQTLP